LKDWNNHIKKKTFNIPVGDGLKVIQPKDDEGKMVNANQKKFRSGIGAFDVSG
jgi:hypothetical protein